MNIYLYEKLQKTITVKKKIQLFLSLLELSVSSRF